MGLFDSISNAVFGRKRPVYQPMPQAVTPMQAPAYKPNPGAQQLGGRLQQILMQQASGTPAAPSVTTQRIGSNLPSITGSPLAGTALPTMPQAVRDAILGRATRDANYAADQSGSRLAESLNAMNLLGSTAQGRGLGEIERSRQDQIGNARDALTAQEFDFQNRERDRQYRERDQQLSERGQGLDAQLQDRAQQLAEQSQLFNQNQGVTDSAQRLLAILQSQGRDENDAAQWAAQFGASELNRVGNERYRGYESLAQQREDQANRNNNLIQTILGGYYLLG